jgi:hypothetical protein
VITNRIGKMKRIVPAVAAVSAVASNSYAGLIDFATVSTSLTTELTSAAGAIMGVAVLLLAANVGWKFVKRFTA